MLFNEATIGSAQGRNLFSQNLGVCEFSLSSSTVETRVSRDSLKTYTLLM